MTPLVLFLVGVSSLFSRARFRGWGQRKDPGVIYDLRVQACSSAALGKALSSDQVENHGGPAHFV